MIRESDECYARRRIVRRHGDDSSRSSDIVTVFPDVSGIPMHRKTNIPDKVAVWAVGRNQAEVIATLCLSSELGEPEEWQETMRTSAGWWQGVLQLRGKAPDAGIIITGHDVAGGCVVTQHE